MSASGQSGSTPTEPDESDAGLCTFCAAPNPRDKIACHFCGSRLPWTFEARGRLKLERKVYLSPVRKGDVDGLESNDIDVKALAKRIALPHNLIDNSVIKPLANPPIGEEVL
jgi:hypothetical protein